MAAAIVKAIKGQSLKKQTPSGNEIEFSESNKRCPSRIIFIAFTGHCMSFT